MRVRLEQKERLPVQQTNYNWNFTMISTYRVRPTYPVQIVSLKVYLALLLVIATALFQAQINHYFML